MELGGVEESVPHYARRPVSSIPTKARALLYGRTVTAPSVSIHPPSTAPPSESSASVEDPPPRYHSLSSGEAIRGDLRAHQNRSMGASLYHHGTIVEESECEDMSAV